MPAMPPDLQTGFTVNAPEIDMNTQRGVTLIELLMALTIAAVLLGLSLPSFASMKMRNSVAATHNLIMGGFATAREAAIVERLPTVLCPGSSDTGCRKDGIWEGGWMIFLDRNDNGTLDSSDTVLRQETAIDGDLAIRSSKHRSRVTFQPSGMAEGSNLTVKLCGADGVAVRGLVTSNTGRTRSSTTKQVAAMTVCF